jgi:hypothetical protein
MHQPIREGLEEYLNGAGDRTIPQDFSAHLASCQECAEEVRLFQDQAQSLRLLRTGEEARPGFYARVMDRIERQTDLSIWSIFLRPTFGRRIAIASAALALLMGAYLVSTEPGEREYSSNPTVVTAADDSPQQQRDAVLANLASYHE